MRLTLVWFTAAALLSAAAAQPANIVTVRNRSGLAQVNYPLQIGRPFADREIPAYPQIGICTDSTCASVNHWLVTQADVKTRWRSAKGPVKHAILSVLLPSLPADSTPVYLTFRDQPDCNCGPAARLSREDMLQPAHAVNASISADFGSGAVVRSLRSMLEAWDGVTLSNPKGPVWYWLEGAIATTIIVADHSLNRRWDFGADENRSLRPIFHVTYWPGIHSAKVRVIVESSNSEAVQDQSYAVSVDSPGAYSYFHPQFTHPALTSWSRTFWTGATPPSEVDIDYNIAYLTHTNALPNLDTTRTPAGSWIANAWAAWQKAPKDLYDSGPVSGYPGWEKNMSAPGGRPDIGPYPRVFVQWAFTGDHRLRQFALGLADLAGAWPARVREGNPEKFLDRAHTTPGLGYPVSITSRPSTNFTTGFSYGYTQAADRIRVVGPIANPGWHFDDAHQPDPWSISYLLTGDYYYLEQGHFWTGYTAHLPNGAGTNNGGYGRGPTGAEGGLDYLQIRSQAWMLRARVEMAEVTPDGWPWKDLLRVWIQDAIAQREGGWNITNSPFFGTINWVWGRKYILPPDALNNVLPPTGAFKKGDRSFVQATYGLDPTASSAAISLFETDYFTYVIGRAKELGYPTGNLVSYLARLYTSMAVNPAFNPYLLQSGRYPTVKADGTYYNTGTELLGAWFATEAEARKAIAGQGGWPVWRGVSSFPLDDSDNGYEFLAAAAISFLTREPDGAMAWDFARKNIARANNIQGTNPKWALVPRSAETAPSLAIVTAALPEARRGYHETLCALGGAPPYTWSLQPGSTLPAGMGLSHSGVISGDALDAAIFTVVVTDSTQSAATRTLAIAVPSGVKDSAPPAVVLLGPLNGAILSGSVTLVAAASDNVGVASVRFKVDGNAVGEPVSIFPYSIPWDTRTAAEGAHTITAVAVDAAGNQSTSPAQTVTVLNLGQPALGPAIKRPK